MIEPVYPLQRCVLDGFEGSPGTAAMDDLGFVKAIDGLCQSVVIAVADAADRGFDAGLSKLFAVSDRDVLAAAIGVMDETATMRWSTIMKSLFGAGAQNCRLTRSSGHGADRSLIAVRTGLPRITPARAIARISRAIVQRAT